ncbi:MAG: hypothetical protein ACP5G4_08930 [bacterium]
MKRSTIIILLLTIALFAREPWMDFFPELREVYAVQAENMIIDLESDADGNLYVLSQSPGRFYVDVYSPEGVNIRSMNDTLNLSEYTNTLALRVSDPGEIVVVRGWDRLLETPVNWVFDSTNTDILKDTGLLKFAEWLSVSPKGNYFALQGYIRKDSQVPFVYDREEQEIEFEYFVEHASFATWKGEEVIIATEIRAESRYLVIRGLESGKIHMERKMTEGESNVIVQETKSALTDKALFILTRVCKNPSLFCYDPHTGDLRWSDESQPDISVVRPALNDEAVILHGNLCSRLIDGIHDPVFNYCEDFEHYNTRLMLTLNAEPTVWPDIEISVLSHTLYIRDYEFHSLILPYANKSNLAAVEIEGKFDGFVLNGVSYVVFAHGSTARVYEIPQ